MTSLRVDHPDSSERCDLTASSVLARVRAAREAEDAAARDKLVACVDWAAIHSSDTIVGPADGWHEQELPLGGEGAPVVAEFAVTELAAALGMSTRAGRGFLSDAVELRYRLPRLFAHLCAGQVRAWRARRIAQATTILSPEAATWVDRQLAPYADTVGPAQLERLIEHAIATFDPDTAEERRLARLPHRHLDIALGRLGVAGVNGIDALVHLDAALDYADAAALEQAVAEIAERLRAAGSPDTLDERRAAALGMLARGDLPLPGLTDEEPEPARPQGPSREVVIYVHLHADATGHVDPTQWAEVSTGRRPPTLVATEQVTAWCRAAGTAVRVAPVIDTRADLTANGYLVPARIAEQVKLRDGVCAFPYCPQPARHADTDHRVPYDTTDPPSGGPTATHNLASLCRHHHRAKTTGGWTYAALPHAPGHYLWRSPHGQAFHTHGHQTWDLTDLTELRRR